MSLTTLGSEPQPSLAWTFESSNVDYVTNLAPSSQVSPGPAQLVGGAALVTNAPTSNTAVSFPGTAGAYMNLGTTSPINFNLTTNNLFVECWVYLNPGVNYPAVLAVGPSSNTPYAWNWALNFSGNSSAPRLGMKHNNKNFDSTISCGIQTWNHVAFSYNYLTGIAYLFVNGQSGGSMSSISGLTYVATDTTLLGTYNDFYSYANMFIRDLRVVQGGVVPTATFTPGAAPFSYVSPTYVAGMGTTVFTLLGQFITYVPGKYGQAMSISNYNGNYTSYVRYPLNASTSTGLTVCFWAKWNENVPPAAGSSNREILRISGPQNFMIFMIDQTKYVGHLYGQNPISPLVQIDAAPPNAGSSTATHRIPVDEWVFYCGTWTPDSGTKTMSLYYYLPNGVIFTGPILYNQAFTITNANIANNSSIAIDDLRIYQNALSAAQVQSIYTMGGAPASSFRSVPQATLAWDFNGTTADYITGLTGTVTGAETYGPGKFNQAAVFNNAVQINETPTYNYTYNSPALLSSAGFTLAWWFNQSNKLSTNYQALVAWSSTSGSYYFDPNVAKAAGGQIGFYGQNPSGSGLVLTIPSGINTVVGTWYHVAFVVNAGTHTMYVNGSQYGTGTYPNEYTLNQIMVARTAQYNGHAFAGSIDDLRIYNTALSSAQVQSIYAAQGMPSRGVQNSKVPSTVNSANGGDTVQDIGGYRIHTFTTVGTSTFTPTFSGDMEVLVVAGGGGGGNSEVFVPGGGGGAGELIYQSALNVSDAISVSVGSGGLNNLPGNDTTFGSLTAKGGGYGGFGSGINGGPGGSGGGARRGNNGSPTGLGGASIKTIGLGNNGGNSIGNLSLSADGGGGGGALGVGSDAGRLPDGSLGTPGGPGYITTISGSSTTYAVGGFGGLRNIQRDGAAASSSTGNGGGGGCSTGAIATGGAGGSGIVIVRYRLPSRLTGTPLFTQLSPSAVSSAVGAFSLRAVNGTTAKAVQVRAQGQFPPTAMTSAATGATTSWSQNLTSPYTWGGSGTYVASSSSVVGDFFPRNAFDKLNINDSNEWASAAGSYSPPTYLGSTATVVSGTTYNGEWLQILFPSTFLATSIDITSPWNAGSARTFVFAGSTNGSTWDLLINQTTATSLNIYNTKQSFTVTTNSYYNYFRLILTTAYETYGQVGELVIFGTPTGAIQDFYADRLGNLLTAPVTGQSLANWLGGATGYVATWYNQLQIGQDVSATVAANQPTIDLVNKTIVFNGSTHSFSNTSPTGGLLAARAGTGTKYTYAARWTKAVAGIGRVCEHNSATFTNNQCSALIAFSTTYGFNGEGNDNSTLVPLTLGTQVSTVMRLDNTSATNLRVRSNGTDYSGATGNYATLSLNNYWFVIGRKASSNSEFFNGTMKNVMVFKDALSDADATVLDAWQQSL